VSLKTRVCCQLAKDRLDTNAHITDANKADDTLGWWSAFTTGAQILFYAMAVGIYRYGKEPVAGHFRDLWGWSCSPAANQVQASILDVNFSQYCSIQVRQQLTKATWIS